MTQLEIFDSKICRNYGNNALKSWPKKHDNRELIDTIIRLPGRGAYLPLKRKKGWHQNLKKGDSNG